MYGVTAASGKLGHLAVLALIERGIAPADVVAIVRTPAKVADLAALGVTVRPGDYDDPASLQAAFEGVDALLLVSGNEMGRRLAQHTAAIEAAKAAGVARIAYTSILKADTSTSPLAGEHLATERALEASGLASTFLRNSWYFENQLDQAGKYLADGALVSSAGPTPFAAATRADYATAAAAALVEEPSGTTIYELGGERITVADIARAISEASGREIAYRDVTPDQQRELLRSAGLPEGYIDLIVDIDRVTGAGEMDTTSTDLARLVGRPLTTLAEAAAAALQPTSA